MKGLKSVVIIFVIGILVQWASCEMMNRELEEDYAYDYDSDEFDDDIPDEDLDKIIFSEDGKFEHEYDEPAPDQKYVNALQCQYIKCSPIEGIRCPADSNSALFKPDGLVLWMEYNQQFPEAQVIDPIESDDELYDQDNYFEEEFDEPAVIAHHIEMPFAPQIPKNNSIVAQQTDTANRTHRIRRYSKDNNSKKEQFVDLNPQTEGTFPANKKITYKDMQDFCCPKMQCKCNFEICKTKCKPPYRATYMLQEKDRKPGKCCEPYECLEPQCIDHNRNFYKDKQEFVSPDDPCSTCKCENGIITCQNSLCHKPACPKLITLPGECCPICDGFCSGSLNCDKACRYGYQWNIVDGCYKCACNRSVTTTTTTTTTETITTELMEATATTDKNDDYDDGEDDVENVDMMMASTSSESPFVLQVHEGKNHTKHHQTDPVINSNFLFYLIVGICVLIVAILLGAFAWRFFTSAKYYAIPLHVKSKYIKSESNCLEM